MRVSSSLTKPAIAQSAEPSQSSRIGRRMYQVDPSQLALQVIHNFTAMVAAILAPGSSCHKSLTVLSLLSGWAVSKCMIMPSQLSRSTEGQSKIRNLGHFTPFVKHLKRNLRGSTEFKSLTFSQSVGHEVLLPQTGTDVATWFSLILYC